jgi:hypothetical protein
MQKFIHVALSLIKTKSQNLLQCSPHQQAQPKPFRDPRNRMNVVITSTKHHARPFFGAINHVGVFLLEAMEKLHFTAFPLGGVD